MNIYNFHPETKEYISKSVADIDPLETKKQGKNVFIAPRNATDKIPPVTTENTVACFENDNWVIKNDFRGQTYYDKNTKEPVIIDFVGDIPSNLQKDPPELTLEELKIKKQAEVTSAYNQKLSSGVEYNQHTFDCDDLASQRIMGKLMKTVAGDIIEWRDYDWVAVEMTREQLVELSNLVANVIETATHKCGNYLTAINATQTVSEINVITIEF